MLTSKETFDNYLALRMGGNYENNADLNVKTIFLTPTGSNDMRGRDEFEEIKSSLPKVEGSTVLSAINKHGGHWDLVKHTYKNGNWEVENIQCKGDGACGLHMVVNTILKSELRNDQFVIDRALEAMFNLKETSSENMNKAVDFLIKIIEAGDEILTQEKYLVIKLKNLKETGGKNTEFWAETKDLELIGKILQKKCSHKAVTHINKHMIEGDEQRKNREDNLQKTIIDNLRGNNNTKKNNYKEEETFKIYQLYGGGDNAVDSIQAIMNYAQENCYEGGTRNDEKKEGGVNEKKEGLVTCIENQFLIKKKHDKYVKLYYLSEDVQLIGAIYDGLSALNDELNKKSPDEDIITATINSIDVAVAESELEINFKNYYFNQNNTAKPGNKTKKPKQTLQENEAENLTPKLDRYVRDVLTDDPEGKSKENNIIKEIAAAPISFISPFREYDPRTNQFVGKDGFHVLSSKLIEIQASEDRKKIISFVNNYGDLSAVVHRFEKGVWKEEKITYNGSEKPLAHILFQAYFAANKRENNSFDGFDLQTHQEPLENEKEVKDFCQNFFLKNGSEEQKTALTKLFSPKDKEEKLTHHETNQIISLFVEIMDKPLLHQGEIVDEKFEVKRSSLIKNLRDKNINKKEEREDFYAKFKGDKGELPSECHEEFAAYKVKSRTKPPLERGRYVSFAEGPPEVYTGEENPEEKSEKPEHSKAAQSLIREPKTGQIFCKYLPKNSEITTPPTSPHNEGDSSDQDLNIVERKQIEQKKKEQGQGQDDHVVKNKGRNKSVITSLNKAKESSQKLASGKILKVENSSRRLLTQGLDEVINLDPEEVSPSSSPIIAPRELTKEQKEGVANLKPLEPFILHKGKTANAVETIPTVKYEDTTKREKDKRGLKKKEVEEDRTEELSKEEKQALRKNIRAQKQAAQQLSAMVSGLENTIN